MMRKIGLTLVAVVMTMGLMAQFPHFGFRIGMTTNKLSSNVEDIFESENRLGYQVGAFARINLGKLYLQPELIYNHRSTELNMIKKDNVLGDVNTTFKLGSIDVPVLLGVKLLDFKAGNVRLFAGPNISFTTDKDVTIKLNGNKVDTDESISTKDFENTTWYVQAGAGIDVLNFTFDVRYEKGLSNMYSGEWEGFDKSFDFKNNVWVFTLGFKIM